MKTMSIAEWNATCRAQGVPRAHIALKCCVCGTVQSMSDLIAAGAGKTEDEVGKYLGFSCVGRYTGAGGHKTGTPPGKGCNWTLGGLFRMHTLEVIDETGKGHPTFEPATAEEAQQHMQAKAAAHV